MPKILDVVLSSLSKDTSNDSFLIQEEIINSDIRNAIKMETLTPPELVEEYKVEFRTYFGAVMDNGTKISSSQFFFKKECNNKTDIDSILKEHSYSKRL